MIGDRFSAVLLPAAERKAVKGAPRSGELFSAVLILPDAHRQTGNLGHIGMGRADEGVAIYSAPLSADGAEPATHWGLHTWAPAEWVDMMMNAKVNGILPDEPWEDYGTTEADVRAAFAALAMSVKPDGDHEGHFDAFAAQLELKRIETPRPAAA